MTCTQHLAWLTINAMTAQTTTLNAQGDLPLTPELREGLGLHAGSPIKITVDGGHLTVQPLLANTPDELNGIFASTPGAFEEVLEELLEERRRSKW